MKKLLLALIFIPSLALAAPAKIPTLSLCLQKNGNLVVKQKCAKSETKLTGGGISALGAQGPAGPVGPAGAHGPSGPSAINGCRNISNSGAAANDGTLILDLACNCTEYMLNYTWSADTLGVFPVQASKLGCQNHTFPAGVGFFFDMTEPTNPFTFNVTAEAVCCPLS